MALRFLYSPSKTRFPYEQQRFSRTPLSNTITYNLSFSCALSSLSHPSPAQTHTLSAKAKRVRNFVLYFSSTAQEQALDSVSAQSDDSEPVPTEEFSRTRLIAQNVPWTCTAEDIRSLFEKHGTVLDVELSMHNKTKNRGLAFVTMGSPEEARMALNNLVSYELEGRTIKVNYAKARKKRPSPSPPVQPNPVTFNLFVANLPFEARSKDLREFFSGSGDVVSAQVIFHDNPRKSSGYGFVAFKSKKDADEALPAFQGKMFMGRPIRVARSRQYVKLRAEEGAESGDTSIQSTPTSAEHADSANEN
ncbi:RNA-binding protein CP31B, chloroplastic-like [Juglans microcarpa x Juglans regia]|uniref:RNA-binding protein CP31B, chloroplastic-like n=1 Tax=Juglans microcarpa x Juglans regia TaxID=2249226 RepID=UPI001B7DD8CD|nr:RNA-binding protein CP31B, chloroplastic-like [Juglans microcarpa x Juglans regia]XP_040998735.1 RNA-binding protein CP31B, chloroplastic-like [Juglans microcarpa x Juglans regia]